MTALLIVLAALAGGALGSYSGVVSARGWRGSLTGRSLCDSCARVLRAWELVPVVSWVVLRGRCARCGARIHVSLLLREVVGALAGACLTLLIVSR